MERFFGNRKITLYASGTAALAQAMANCASRSSVRTPEVIIPAYGCPDLVAACVHASVYPRLVDVAQSVWSYDLEALKSSLSANTVAIVAINLLGLGDRLRRTDPPLQRQTHSTHSGQRTISSAREHRLARRICGVELRPRQTSQPAAWRRAHLTIGRQRFNVSSAAHYTARARLLSSRAAAMAFNALTRPTIYRIFSALPGTGLGEVIYKPLTNPAPLPERAWQRVATAFELYRQKPSYRRDIWTAAIEEWSDLGIVAFDSPGLPLSKPSRCVSRCWRPIVPRATRS